MKAYISFILLFISALAFAQDGTVRTYYVNTGTSKNDKYTTAPAGLVPDSLSLQEANGVAYYQKVVKLDSNIPEPALYMNLLQFMAAKNYQLNFGNQQDGKMIFVTNQDLNNNTNDNDPLEPYTAQFSVELDLKAGRYRYTVTNVVFFSPVGDYGNRRFTLFDVYQKAVNTDSKRTAREARTFISSFERYLGGFLTEMHLAAQKKLIATNPTF